MLTKPKAQQQQIVHGTLGHQGIALPKPPTPKKVKAGFTVQDIHDDFDSAVDSIISKALTADVDKILKAEKLKSLGFGQSQPVVEIAEHAREIREHQELSVLVDYFKTFYPNNKFITHELVQGICTKYGLVFGMACDFKGDIPDKNAAEMAAFTLRPEDHRHSPVGWCCNHGSWKWYFYGDRNPDSTGNCVRGYITDDGGVVQINDETILESITKPSLRVCAPQSQFDMKNLKVAADGFTLIDKDPIVLQPVKGGYLIVSKWGAEANDQKLVVETHN